MKTFSISLLLTAALLASACATNGSKMASASNSPMASPSPNVADVEKTLFQFEQEGAAAMAKNDLSWVEKNLPEDIFYTSADGTVVSKEEMIKSFKNSDFKYESAAVDDMKAHVYGDSAVVTGRLKYSASAKGKHFNAVERWTDTFVKRNGRWEPVATHSSAVKQ